MEGAAHFLGVPKPVVIATLAVGAELGLNPTQLKRPSMVPVELMLMTVRQLIAQWQLPKVHDLVYIFAGAGGAVAQCTRMGGSGTTCEKLDHECQDVLSVVGCIWAFYMIHSVKLEGVVWFSPSCDPWLGFMTRATTCRGKTAPDIVGDESVQMVANGNDCAFPCSVMMFEARIIARAHVGLEQPMNSMLFKYPCVRNSLEQIGTHRYICCAGALGATSEKPLELHLTVPETMAIRLFQRNRTDARSRFERDGVEVKKLAEVRGKWTCGTKAMKTSKVYPAGLDQAIATCALSLTNVITSNTEV